MSTPASNRLRLSLAALGVVALAYAGAHAGLQLLARHAERRGEVYPYRVEDWLRYLLPSLWPRSGAPLILLAGPSTVREALLVEDFQAAFPGSRIFQGGLSSGTLGDVEASLAYIERTRGSSALPATIVLGLSPRFLAELPTQRPFALGLARYSRRFAVPGQDAAGFDLVPKSTPRGLADRARFLLLKQGPRYRTALAWLGERVMERVGLQREGGLVGAVARTVYHWTQRWTIPSRYRDNKPWTAQMIGSQLDNPRSWWHLVHAWNPAADSAGTRARAAAFLDFTDRHHIELFLVDLPDHSMSRTRYHPGYSAAYVALRRSVFPNVPLLGLRCLLSDEQFLDAEHPRVAGAHLVTRQTIRFMHAVRAWRLRPADSAVAARVSRLASSGACEDLP